MSNCPMFSTPPICRVCVLILRRDSWSNRICLYVLYHGCTYAGTLSCAATPRFAYPSVHCLSSASYVFTYTSPRRLMGSRTYIPGILQVLSLLLRRRGVLEPALQCICCASLDLPPWSLFSALEEKRQAQGICDELLSSENQEN